MLLKAALLVAFAAIAFAATDHIIAGDFTGVDSVASNGFAAFRHPTANDASTSSDTKRYPNGQFLLPHGGAPSFISGSALRAYAQDGSIVGTNVAQGPGSLAANSELWLLHNATGQFARRLFGFNGYFGFDNGQPAGQPNPRSAPNYVGLIQNLAFLGSAPNRQLVVCMGDNSANNRLLVGNTSLPNPSTLNPTPTPLANQLLLFTESSSSGFLVTGGIVNTPVSATPTSITPQYTPPTGPVQLNAQPGVDCSTLVAGGKTVMIRTPGGPYYLTNDVGSVSRTTWTQATRDPNKAPPVDLGSPLTNPIYFLGAETGNPSIYWYGANPSDTTLTQNDGFNTFYKYSAGTSWTPVVPVQIIKNVTATQYVVGNGGDNEIYFTLAAVPDVSVLPSFLDGIRMPIEDYVFMGGSSGFNYIAPLYQLQRTAAINLHYDINLPSLVVFSDDLGGVLVGNRLTYKVPEDDRRYFSKGYAAVVRYDSTNSRYVQAYGGGFDGAVGRIVSTTNGITYFEGGFSYGFQRATGPISMWNSALGVWDYSYGAAFERIDIDGGDFHGMLNSPAAVYDVQRMSFLGNDGLLVAGEFRTADDGTIPCNSICFFPKSGGAKIALFDSPASSFYNNSGVRRADPVSASAVIPEHADSVPGLVSNIVIDGSTIFVGGTFGIAGDKAASNFALFTLSSKAFATGWSNAYGGVDAPVLTMVKHDGAVYIGGNFKNVGPSIKANHIAGFSLRTRTWFTLNRGLDGTVYKLVEYKGKLLAVGSFLTGSGQTLGFTGLWDGKKWSPLTDDNHNPGDSCLISFCYASDIPGATGVYDAFVYGSTPYMMLAAGAGNLQLIVFDSPHLGFVRVDGGWSRDAAPQFTSTAIQGDSNYFPGVSFISTAPSGGRRLDLWNVEQSGQSPDLQTKRVSTFNLDEYNFENNAATGTNGFVFIALPEFAGLSAALVASMTLVFSALALLLL